MSMKLMRGMALVAISPCALACDCSWTSSCGPRGCDDCKPDGSPCFPQCCPLAPPPPPPPAPTPAPTPRPTPAPPSADCPGGSLSACMGVCPSDAKAYKTCVTECIKRCASPPAPTPAPPTPTPPPTPPPGPVGPWQHLNQAIMTHYWDCCKLSCSWNDAGSDNSGGALVKTCGGGPNDQSTCGGGPAYACTDQLPWVEDDTLYGFVANQDTGSKADCGTCFELQLSNAGVSKAIVQLTNKGGMGSDQHGKAVFDFLVPGGGFGQFTGCSSVPGWKVYTNQGGPCDPNTDSPQCARYGGFKDASSCDVAFPGDDAAKKACKDVLFGVFPSQQGSFAGNPVVTARRTIPCPQALIAKSGVDGIKQQTTHDFNSLSWLHSSNVSIV